MHSAYEEALRTGLYDDKSMTSQRGLITVALVLMVWCVFEAVDWYFATNIQVLADIGEAQSTLEATVHPVGTSQLKLKLKRAASKGAKRAAERAVASSHVIKRVVVTVPRANLRMAKHIRAFCKDINHAVQVGQFRVKIKKPTLVQPEQAPAKMSRRASFLAKMKRAQEAIKNW